MSPVLLSSWGTTRLFHSLTPTGSVIRMVDHSRCAVIRVRPTTQLDRHRFEAQHGVKINYGFDLCKKTTQIERFWLVEVKSWERRERCGKLTSEIGSVRDYFIIYHYNVLEDGQRAMPSGVQSTRPFINVLCVSWEWFEEVCFLKRIIMSRWVRAGEWRFPPRVSAVNHG